ncbi:MAG: FMN-binding negative transcriptional regulator [Actinomycetota bacterium]|nr:FMN-binding negative transcriptional regulator [Actinomycetota bacterium]
MRFYNPSAFQIEDLSELVGFIEKNPLATVITSRGGETFVSHLPFVPHLEGGKITLNSHFSKSNPHLDICHEVPDVYLVFHGVSSGITPTLYSAVGVPTWNYSTVHLKGSIRFLVGSDSDLALEVMTRHFEDKRSSSFTSTSTDPYVVSMKRGIEVVEVEVSEIEGKFKLSQNRPVEDRLAVAKYLAKSSDLQDQRTSLEMMRVNNLNIEE